MITFLSKWSCKVDNAQDRTMLEGPLIILNPNCRHCCPCLMTPLSSVLVPLCMLDIFLQINVKACGQKLLL